MIRPDGELDGVAGQLERHGWRYDGEMWCQQFRGVTRRRTRLELRYDYDLVPHRTPVRKALVQIEHMSDRELASLAQRDPGINIAAAISGRMTPADLAGRRSYYTLPREYPFGPVGRVRRTRRLARIAELAAHSPR